ncbi:hypothetical protein Gpo141_00015065, partial [Globisporangium polare]
MLALPPLSLTLLAQVLAAPITAALTSVLVAIGSSIRRKMRAKKLLAAVRGLKGRFLLGFVPEMVKNLHRIYDFQGCCDVELITSYGGRVKLPWSLFSDNMIYLSDPKDIEHILSTNMDNYVKSTHFGKSV